MIACWFTFVTVSKKWYHLFFKSASYCYSQLLQKSTGQQAFFSVFFAFPEGWSFLYRGRVQKKRHNKVVLPKTIYMKQYFAKLFFKNVLALLLAGGGLQLAAQPIQPLLDSSDGFYYKGNFKKALDIARMAEAIALRDSGEKSRVYAQVIGEYYSMNNEALGRFDSAEFYYKKGIGIYRELGAVTDTVYATLLINIGNLYNHTQKQSMAGPYFDEAYPIIKQYMSRQNIDYAATLNDLGLYYYHTNQFSKAEVVYKESLELMEQYHPHNLDTVMFAVVNLVEMYKIMGAFSKAYETERRFLSKLDPLKVKDKKAILSGLLQLNELALYMPPVTNITDSINNIMEQMKQGSTDTNHINACILANRLRHYLFTKKSAEAIKLHEDIAGRGYDRYFAGGETAVIDIVTTMLDVFIQAGKADKAQALFETLVYADGKWLETNMVRKWMYMQQGAAIYTVTNNRVKAKEIIKQLIEFSRIGMYPYFAAMPDYMRWNLVKQLRIFVSTIAFYMSKMGDDDQQLVNLLFDYQLRLRGAIMNEKILLHKYVRQSGIGGALDSLNLLNDLQSKIAKIYVSNNQGQLGKLEQRAAKLDAYLRKLVPAFAAIDTVPLTLQALQRQLKPGEVLVDFIRFTNTDSSYYLKSGLMYGALVLTGADTVPKFVPLCSEADIISIFEASNRQPYGKGGNVANLVKETMQYKGRSVRPLTELYKITWQKLEKYFVPGKTKLYYIPNGQFCILPMEAFGKSKGHYIRNDIEMEQLQSYLTFSYRAGPPAKKKNTMELWGDIDYGEAKAKKNQEKAFVSLGKKEVNNILEVLTGSSFVIRQYMRGEATENLFKTTPHKNEVVHLSTHGFYRPQWDMMRQNFTYGFNKTTEAPLYSHLLFSGLAFAGANKTKAFDAGLAPAGKTALAEEGNDGILYSYEIKDIDLSAADLVVLSACETGLGMIVMDEGVMGLQQAFRLAGASKVIMSLWEVNKQYTQDWMKIFYSYYKGDAEAAYNSTQNQLIADGKPPYNWAGFVLIK
jgi:CHAT domain-containing protein/tetratricopeptide (TPR) repeat protein